MWPNATNALFGAIGGMIIVGVAFMVPRLISETVIEPSGGASLGGSSVTSCDQVFKNQLVRNQAAGSGARMNQIKVQVQQRQQECAAEVWDPLIITGTDLAKVVRPGWGGTAATYPGRGTGIAPPAAYATDQAKCGSLATTATDDFNTRTIGGLQVPPDLERFVSVAGPLGAGLNSGRDGNNNIILYFGGHGDERPSDGAPCWMYVERFGSWVSGTQN